MQKHITDTQKQSKLSSKPKRFCITLVKNRDLRPDGSNQPKVSIKNPNQIYISGSEKRKFVRKMNKFKSLLTEFGKDLKLKKSKQVSCMTNH